MRPIDADKLKKELVPYEENDFSQQMDVILKIVDMQPALTPQNEWVSVEERLPPPNIRVLAYRPGEGDNSPYKYTNMWGWAVKESIRHKGITHWMYYPAPPDLRPPKRPEDNHG